MICEMCGGDVPKTRRMTVQGAYLNLCDKCARFGEGYRPLPSSDDRPAEASSRGVIDQRLERRERRMQTRDIYAGAAAVELIPGYGKAIRQAREAKGLSMDDFAKSIGVKKLTLNKVEAGNLTPDDKLVAILEKALGIKLKEAVQSGAPAGGGQKSQGMTLANFVREDKRKGRPSFPAGRDLGVGPVGQAGDVHAGVAQDQQRGGHHLHAQPPADGVAFGHELPLGYAGGHGLFDHFREHVAGRRRSVSDAPSPPLRDPFGDRLLQGLRWGVGDWHLHGGVVSGRPGVSVGLLDRPRLDKQGE